MADSPALGEDVAAMSAMGQLQSSPTDLLSAAIKSGNTSAALSLLVQFPMAVHGVDTQDGATAMHWAALFGNMEVIEALAGEGAKLDVTVEASGMQPIHWAATQGRTDVVKFLVARGVDVNSVDIKQTTPLVIAAQYDHSVLVFYLVKEGADISKLDDCNDSALHWAAYKGNLHTAALLHYLGLPAAAADTYGSTPLHLAAARNAPHVIEYLIDESSSSIESLTKAKDNKGRTPLDIAKERSNPLAVRLLQRASPTLRTRCINLIMGTDGSKMLWYFYMINATLCYIMYALVIAPVVGTVEQHYAAVAAAVLMQLSYIVVHAVHPGTIDTGRAGRQAYEDALQAAAEGSLTDTSSMRTRAAHEPNPTPLATDLAQFDARPCAAVSACAQRLCATRAASSSRCARSTARPSSGACPCLITTARTSTTPSAGRITSTSSASSSSGSSAPHSSSSARCSTCCMSVCATVWCGFSSST